MIGAKFPDGHEITRNQAYFHSLPDAPPESVVQKQPEHEQMTPTTVHESNESCQERSIAKDRARRNIKKPQRLIEEDV